MLPAGKANLASLVLPLVAGTAHADSNHADRCGAGAGGMARCPPAPTVGGTRAGLIAPDELHSNSTCGLAQAESAEFHTSI